MRYHLSLRGRLFEHTSKERCSMKLIRLSNLLSGQVAQTRPVPGSVTSKVLPEAARSHSPWTYDAWWKREWSLRSKN